MQIGLKYAKTNKSLLPWHLEMIHLRGFKVLPTLKSCLNNLQNSYIHINKRMRGGPKPFLKSILILLLLLLRVIFSIGSYIFKKFINSSSFLTRKAKAKISSSKCEKSKANIEISKSRRSYICFASTFPSRKAILK